MNQSDWDFKWLSVAWVTSLMSKDPSTKVGAALVSPDNKKVSTGYNGFPAGVEETTDKWERPLKYEYVIHAEKNAIGQATFDKDGCTMYLTMQPCHICLGYVLNQGIKRIVYNYDYDRLCHRDVWDDIAKGYDEIRRVDRDIRQEVIDKLQS